MKFAHMADCHIGGWRDPKMQSASMEAFVQAIDTCIERRVDFLLIAGDLFNTSVPSIDRLKEAFIKLSELKEAGIPMYFIPGSHDYSPSGKTMLDIIEVSGFGTNVMKGDINENGMLELEFTEDQKTGAKITGIYGRKGGLESDLFKNLSEIALETDGYRIFMFHTAITEMKTKDLEMMDSMSMKSLPKGFDYYAGGHVHIVAQEKKEKGNIAYPGPLFPNSFSEFEKLSHGGFFIIEDDEAAYVPLKLYRHLPIVVECEKLTPAQVEEEVRRKYKEAELGHAIVTLRVQGELISGKTIDIDFRAMIKEMYDKGAYFVMKNTSGLKSPEISEVKVDAASTDEIESRIISETESILEDETVVELMRALGSAQNDDEKKSEYETRVKADALKVLGL